MNGHFSIKIYPFVVFFLLFFLPELFNTVWKMTSFDHFFVWIWHIYLANMFFAMDPGNSVIRMFWHTYVS